MPASLTLKERLQQDTHAALRAGDKARLSVLRLAMAAIKQREVDFRETLSDAGVLSLLEKMVKQRQDSIAQFQQGNRADLVAKEQAEVEVIKEYLPVPLSGAETAMLVDEVIAATAASSPKDMGAVMAELKARAAGRIDMGEAGGLVKARLLGR